jgi:aquaporin Z
VEELRMNSRAYLAELVGTFLFLSIGYASVPAFAVASAPTPNLLVVPFAFGLGLLAAIFAFGHISGGHFNPAVTIAMVLDKRTTPIDAVGYIAAQVIGALGAGLLILLALNQDAVKAGITAPGTGVSDMGALILETAFTAFFLVVILASTKRAPALAALAIPLTLVAIHFGIATLSGSSVNPARSIGSAVVGGDLSHIWIYIVGPIVGGIIGWGAWRLIDGGEDEGAAAA